MVRDKNLNICTVLLYSTTWVSLLSKLHTNLCNCAVTTHMVQIFLFSRELEGSLCDSNVTVIQKNELLNLLR